jgi:UDP-N-acetylmuramoyl-tripeptide--D-alanyl-D-alanine ligase
MRTALARWNRRNHPATFIAITGSSGKSTTAALLSHVLAGHASTRMNHLSNTLPRVSKTVAQASRKDRFVVLEIGASAKGSVAEMAGIVQPDIAIVTMVGLEHYKAFRSMEAVAEEKGYLVEAVRPGGFALLNADDENVLAMRARTAERIVTFGRSDSADLRVLSTDFTFPGPLSVRIVWKGGEETLICPLLGSHFWVSVVAAFAAAAELGVPTALIKQRMAGFTTVRNRCEAFEIPGGPTFIVDTAKAPHGTVGLAFDLVAAAPAGRKRIVIGQISDYSGNPYSRYHSTYKLARVAADEVIGVGENAHKLRAPEGDVASGRFRKFADVRDLYTYLRETADEGDLILLKSGSILHLERIPLAWQGDVHCWQTRCGRKEDCFTCGLYGVPFEDHAHTRRRARRQRRMAALGNALAYPLRQLASVWREA